MFAMSAYADVQILTIFGNHLDHFSKKLGCTLRERLTELFLKVRNKRGRLVVLRPNRAQREFEEKRGRRNIVLKARQLGISTWIAARFFINTITRPGTVTVQVAHDQNSAEEIFRIVYRFLENLPKWLRNGALVTSRANVRQIVFPRLDSEYRVETAADPNAGRGLTIRNLHCSEVARWPRDAAGTLASLRAAVPPDGEIVLESTPAGAGGCFYDEWQRAEESGTVQHFFPWWFAKEYSADGLRLTVDRSPSTVDDLTEEERGLISQHGLSLAQIAFRRQLRADFRGLAKQEFAEDPVSCFLASGECVFDVEAIQRRMSELGPAVETRDNGRLQIWYPPQPNWDYVIGVDTAGGGSEGDYACAQVIDRTHGRQCAELHGHYPPRELATRVAALGREYNNAQLVVERNNHGCGVLVYLDDVLAYPRIYCEGGQAGMVTTALSRPRMLEWLVSRVDSETSLFASARLLQECRTLVRHADGSASAASGSHDDCVMAMAFAQWARFLEQSRLGTREIKLGSFER